MPPCSVRRGLSPFARLSNGEAVPPCSVRRGLSPFFARLSRGEAVLPCSVRRGLSPFPSGDDTEASRAAAADLGESFCDRVRVTERLRRGRTPSSLNSLSNVSRVRYGATVRRATHHN